MLLALNCFIQTFPISSPNDLFLGNELVNDGVQQDSSNSNGASEQLDGVEGFSEDKGNTNNDDDTLGGVGNGLRDGTGLLQGQGGALVVSVEPQTGGNHVLPDCRSSLSRLNEFTESASFSDGNNRDGQKESQDGGDGELVSDGSHAVLQTWGFHELLVLVTLDGGEHVGNAGRDEGGPGEVKFLHGCQDDSSNDNRKTQPLGLGDWLSIDVLGKDGSEGGFGSLNNLGERDGSHSHGEDGGGVGSHEAESNGKHFYQILHGDFRLGAGIGSEPEEKTVDGTNSELQRRNGHGESNLSSSSVEGKLVGDVVVVVTEVPQDEVCNEPKIKSSRLGRGGISGSSTDSDSIRNIVQGDVGETVSLDIDGLDQCWLLEGTDRSSGRLSQSLGASVEAEGRGRCGKDGKEGEGGDLHGCQIGPF
mmetsp:Transcript_10810/g.31475  ORF Transcript_10810/g.31475 Transcript_10810/m.31475 type:complete len:419 (+) Transcript_10810:194-1450(+)